MSLRILVGCKRVIDYAVKVRDFLWVQLGTLILKSFDYDLHLDSSSTGQEGRRHSGGEALAQSLR